MSTMLPHTDPRARAGSRAIREGDLPALEAWLAQHPDLVRCRIDDGTARRTLLHLATDWPGHFPRVREVIERLIAAGAEVNAPLVGPHAEGPLHWAASSNDVHALEALLAAGADVDLPGAVIDGGTPLSDAVGFGNSEAARVLVDAGATVKLWHAAALGLVERLPDLVEGAPSSWVTAALWHGAGRGHLEVVRLLLEAGGDPTWVPKWDEVDAVAAARKGGHGEVVAFLTSSISSRRWRRHPDSNRG